MWVADVDEIVERIAASGCPVPTPVTQFAPGTRFAIVEDPEGNRIEFVQSVEH